MKKSIVDSAIVEAQRFLRAAKELELHAEIQTIGKEDYYQNSPKQTGSIKRASMDLTRALADLRRRGD